MTDKKPPEIRFYHLERQSLEHALPALLNKIYKGGHKIVVKCTDEGAVESLDNLLWVYRPDVFLPHGSKKIGQAEHQPIWLTADDENPNDAAVLVAANGAEYEAKKEYTIICDIFDGRHEESLTAARKRWSNLKSQNHNLTYWKQNEKGWEQAS